MRGELIGVWSEMWRSVWKKLGDHKEAPDDLFCELYRELNDARAAPLDPATDLANIVDDPVQARSAFRDTPVADLAGEQAAVAFLERAHTEIENLGSHALTNRYFLLIEAFLDKFSLRYDLRRPFSLHPTLPGVFARLLGDLKEQARSNPDLQRSLQHFEEAFRDLKFGPSPERISTVIVKHMNLLEAISRENPDLNDNTLGAISREALRLPHSALQAGVCEFISKVYGFSSSYPDMRHGGNPAARLRELNLDDLLALSITLTGVIPYLDANTDSERVYFCD